MALQASMGGAFVNPALAFDFQYPPQLVSASFNGSSQNLSVPTSSALTLGTNDHTVEFWMRQTSRGSYDVPWAYDGTAVAFAGTYYMLMVGSVEFKLFLGNGAGAWAVNLNCGSAPSLNAWHHYAIVRSGTTFTVYVDGTSVASTTSAQSIPAQVNPMYIGYQPVNGRITGSLSNLRLVNGTAVYNSNFTVPTKPLLAITNTALLVSMGATPFIDTSTNAFTITNTATVVTNNLSPFPATWTDSLNGIVATVATLPNAASTSNPKYDGRYGGGIVIAQTSQSYVDVPTARGPGGGFTISMAAVLPIAQGDHYVPIFDGAVLDRVGQYINARNWVGDGLEVGGQATWAASNSTTVPSMQTLAWWDFVFNGQFVNVYKNGAAVTMANSNMGSGNSILGWKNPLRFAGDDSIAANNTMWPGTLYRMLHTKTALSAVEVTAQFTAVRSTYGL
jgi:hypothetical protein